LKNVETVRDLGGRDRVTLASRECRPGMPAGND